MGFWHNVDSLRALSHVLMWATGIFGVLAALATGARYYVDRRVGQVSALAQRAEVEKRDQAQAAREAELRGQLAAADLAARQADEQARQAASTAEKLRIAAQPRVLEVRARKDAFFRSLGEEPGGMAVVVDSPMGNAEAREMAQELKAMFLARGWNADGAQSIVTGTPTGVIVYGDPGSADVKRIVAALTALGFPPEVRVAAERSDIRVLVAHKP
jgi:hypothetical protein